jgi:hypothetical protein
MNILRAPIPVMPEDVVKLINEAQTIDELREIQAKYGKEHFWGFSFLIEHRWSEIKFSNLEQRVEALEKHD